MRGSVLAWLFTAGLAVLGALRLSRGWVALVAASVGSMLAVLWAWWYFAPDKLGDRLTTSFLAWFVGLLASAWLGVFVDRGGLAAAALIAAGGTVVLARARWSLRGQPLPDQGEARGRVWFAGTAHTLGQAALMPGADRAVVLWLGRQYWRRWGSSERFEVRDGARRVWVAPTPPEVRLTGRSWLMRRAIGRAAARSIGGRADPGRPLRMHYLDEGDMVHVVGVARPSDDPGAPTYRDPVRISLFSGPLVVGDGGLAAARRRALLGILAWAALALAAGALAVSRFTS